MPGLRAVPPLMRSRLEREIEIEQRPAQLGWQSSPLRDRLTWLRDILIAAALIAITLPLVAFVALAIKLDSAGPVFSRNPRLGRDGRYFFALKFRTTVHDPGQASWPVWYWDRAARETRVGQLLRYTRIDDVPQLINVLRGEMKLLDIEDRADTPQDR